METRTLGRTGLRVSAVGFGGGGIGQVWGETTDTESVRAVHRALELGVTFFDVAPGYGDGRAERVLGDGLQGRRDDVTVMTKVNLAPEQLDDIEEAVKASVEASLQRIRTDHVELLIIHNMVTSARGRPYKTAITVEDAMRMADAMDALKKAKKVRHIGFTAWRCTDAALTALLDSGRFSVLQSEVNMLNRSALEPAVPGSGHENMAELERDGSDVAMRELGYRGTDQHEAIRRASEADIGVVAIRPLMAGALTDALDREETSPDMHRMQARADRLRFLLDDRRPTLSSVALRYVLAQPGPTTVVPGVKNQAEIEDAVAAAELPEFTEAELARIASISAGKEDDA
jgi:aryl-alcohol dehydrogenase-like predicted oxidoreductase